MRENLFDRVTKLIKEGSIKPIFKGEYKEIFEVKGKDTIYTVTIEYEPRNGQMNGIFRWSCDCPYMGIIGVPNRAMCSHCISVICYKVLKPTQKNN